VSSFKASATTESTHNIAHTENHVAKDAVIWADVMVRKCVDVHCLLWAYDTLVNLHALSEEELVKFINVITGTEHAFVTPEMLKVITADPLPDVLVLVPQVCLEACASRKTSSKLGSCNHSVTKELKLILFLLEQVLQHHSSILLVLRNNIESHIICVFC